MQMEVAQDGDTLTVFPTLVYGDPPRARVDGRTLVHLNGALPIRDEDAERRLVHRLRDELNLVPGRRVQLVGREAFVMQQGLVALAAHRCEGRRRREARAARGSARHRRATSSTSSSTAPTAPRRPRSRRRCARGKPASTSCRSPAVAGAACRRSGSIKHGERLADLLAARTSDRRVPIYALPDLAKLAVELDQPPPPELERLRPLLAGFAGIPHVDRRAPASSENCGRISNPASTGSRSVATPDSAACSPTTWASARRSRRSRSCRRGKNTLVVCPKSVLFNWMAEIQQFRPDLTVVDVRGHAPRARSRPRISC